MHRRTRLTLLGIAAFLVAIVLAAVVAMHLLLQPQRFTDLLRAQASRAGLTLTLSAPASPTLWPEPSLVLHGVTLSVDNRPVLIAARARLVLPWRTLFGGPTTITRLELDGPRINLAQIGPVMANMSHGHTASPSLPRIDAGVRIRGGSLVRGNDLLLDDINLETGPLSPGHMFSMKLTGKTAHGHPATLTVLMTPHEHPGAISLDNIHIVASGPSGLACTLDGKATWRGSSNIHLSLHGTFTRSPQRRYATALTLQPASDGASFALRLKLDGPGLNADVSLSPSRLVSWWHTISNDQAATDIPLPPLTGTVDAKEITLGDMHIEGLHLRAGPAAASSTPAAATSAPAKP